MTGREPSAASSAALTLHPEVRSALEELRDIAPGDLYAMLRLRRRIQGLPYPDAVRKLFSDECGRKKGAEIARAILEDYPTMRELPQHFLRTPGAQMSHVNPEGTLLERLRYRAMSATANNQGITAAILTEAADEIEALSAKVNEDRLTRWTLRARLDRAVNRLHELGEVEPGE